MASSRPVLEAPSLAPAKVVLRNACPLGSLNCICGTGELGTGWTEDEEGLAAAETDLPRSHPAKHNMHAVAHKQIRVLRTIAPPDKSLSLRLNKCCKSLAFTAK